MVAKSKTGYEKFVEATSPKHDAVTIILRAHLLVEYYLDQLLLKNLPRGDILLESRFSFSQKIVVLRALGPNVLRSEVIDCIAGLNKVRNYCSHEMNYQVKESDADKIGAPFGKQYFDIKEKHKKDICELLHWTLALPIASLQILVPEE